LFHWWAFTQDGAAIVPFVVTVSCRHLRAIVLLLSAVAMFISHAGGIFLVLALGLAQHDGALTTCSSWGEAKPIDRSFFAAGFVVAAYALDVTKDAETNS
jgi:hypothetical protein